MNAPNRPVESPSRRRVVPALAAALCAAAFAPSLAAQGYPQLPGQGAQVGPPETPVRACFLLADLGGSELRRKPANGCDRRVSPAATFEIAAALAALDASIVRSNGTSSGGQTLDSALAYSSPGYFRDIDRQMGSVRMGEYLNRFGYGNADTRSGGEYWNGGSLQISPNEQLRFLQKLFGDQLPVSRQAAASVRESLEPPSWIMTSRGRVIAASGAMRGGVPPVVKAGVIDAGGEAVRWQVGLLTRGTRNYVFVSCVTGPVGLPQDAAVVVANNELVDAGIL
ncbi:penicillin-binding transpeptidase domain-containing protein [Lysobacter enzymogenes]|uniref:penicillin-binding transpeptidase domain-containing protein n=1 Tax=Lysobacter enzymogenes TaxID=69 RepID=UPI00384AC3B1